MSSLNKAKYKNAILYFLEHINNSHLGKVKLMKLLYYMDFDHFEKCGTSITGDEYKNYPAGPVPEGGDAILKEMQAEGLIDISKEQVIDYLKYKYTPKARHEPSAFLPSEVEILSSVAEKWEHHSTNEIIAASHGEAPWLATENGETIPYALAYYRGKYDEPLTEVEEEGEVVC